MFEGMLDGTEDPKCWILGCIGWLDGTVETEGFLADLDDGAANKPDQEDGTELVVQMLVGLMHGWLDGWIKTEGCPEGGINGIKHP